MKEIDSPFLELHFYNAKKKENEVMREMISFLCQKGAKLSGKGQAYSKIAFPEKFAGINDYKQEFIHIDSLKDYDDLSTIYQIISLKIEGASGIHLNKFEILTFTSVPEEIKNITNHPIAIFTEANDIEDDNILNSNKISTIIHNRFIEICENLDITYGAICNELSMETPEELELLNYKSIAFKDFFINKNHYDDNVLQSLFDLAKKYNANIEILDKGYFISVSKYFQKNKNENLPQDISDKFSMLSSKFIANYRKINEQ